MTLLWVASFPDLPLEVQALLRAKTPLSPSGWAAEDGEFDFWLLQEAWAASPARGSGQAVERSDFSRCFLIQSQLLELSVLPRK